ncbi:hypothetical protein GOP47_0011545 [Adiantum capillus-veneris]|uniref:Uncharacterized protein n=1 Tax=Adiantum capillus-veneris TaxID=13818 RepID=A0A9D4UTG2_ADICA|nr:hypothetical protein GOP47_0011545 [Adiantum capillus-veneris]
MVEISCCPTTFLDCTELPAHHAAAAFYGKSLISPSRLQWSAITCNLLTLARGQGAAREGEGARIVQRWRGGSAISCSPTQAAVSPKSSAAETRSLKVKSNQRT